MSPGTKMRQITVSEEFEKNPDLSKEGLNQLKEWVATQKHLPVIKDQMLILFYHSCYFDLDRAKDCIEVYYTIRTIAPELFTNRDVNNPELKKYMSALNMAILPATDPAGCQIMYHGLRESDPSRYSHIYDNKIIYMTMDSCLIERGTCPGFVLMFDMKGAKLGHLTRVSLSIVRIGSKYVQEGSPLRLKAIHIINTLPWVDKILAIIRPFTSKEIFELMHFHKEGNIETLYQYIPRESLPCDLGGTLPSIEELSDENTRNLERFRDYFLEEENDRVDKTKRAKKNKKNKKVDEMPDRQFKSLEID